MRSASLCLLLSAPVLAGPAPFAARRRAALEKAPDGIVLLHANSGFKRWEEAGFLQDPAFLYFTGLRNAQAAILALDGPAKATWLFVRPPFRVGAEPRGFDAIFVKPGPEAEAELRIDHVAAWDGCSWPLHGLGLDMAEGTPKAFRAGNVLCYEPMVEVDGDVYFLEDTILVTPGGHEILNPPLPYAAADLEKEITARRKP